MPIISLKKAEKDKLLDLFFRLHNLSKKHPTAKEEIMTALRCLKAVHSNAIEDRSIDRVFLQILLHKAGISDKNMISSAYQKASFELHGQEEMLRWLETLSKAQEPVSISLLLKMHKQIFSRSWPDTAGRFRDIEVQISDMSHMPPHPQQVSQLLHQHLITMNEQLSNFRDLRPDNFFDVLRLSAQAQYLVAHIHPFQDGNGRIARAFGDYILLYFDMFYDVIMTDYRDAYLDAMVECDMSNADPLFNFLQFSYLETLERISTFFNLLKV